MAIDWLEHKTQKKAYYNWYDREGLLEKSGTQPFTKAVRLNSLQRMCTISSTYVVLDEEGGLTSLKTDF